MGFQSVLTGSSLGMWYNGGLVRTEPSIQVVGILIQTGPFENNTQESTHLVGRQRQELRGRGRHYTLHCRGRRYMERLARIEIARPTDVKEEEVQCVGFQRYGSRKGALCAARGKQHGQLSYRC